MRTAGTNAAWVTFFCALGPAGLIGVLGLLGCDAEPDVRPRRNPYEGTCVAADLAEADWPPCSTHCDALDATTCGATGACRKIATAECTTTQFPVTDFVTCWATVGYEPLHGTDCYAILDAEECARHDDCMAVHDHTICDGTSYVSAFMYCWAENDPLPPPPPPPPAPGTPPAIPPLD